MGNASLNKNSQSSLPKRIFYSAAIYFISAVLITSGISKIIDPVSFLETIKATGPS